MTRRTVWLVVVVYLAAALAFGAYETSLETLWTKGFGFSAEAFGRGIGVFLIAAIVPMIVWAFSKFRKERAALPLVLWAVIAIGLGYLGHVGIAADRILRHEAFVGDGLVGKDKDDFLRSASMSCEKQQRASTLTKQAGISDGKITDYCHCYAEGIAAAITKDEMLVLIRTQKPPASFVEKTTTMSQFCGEQVLRPKK